MIYLSSDLHFCHNKDFIYKPRGYEDIDEHDIDIIKRFNSIVTEEDDVYLLGDYMLTDNEKGMKYINQLKGHLHFLLGNHDTSARKELLQSKPCSTMEGYATVIKYKGWSFYLSHYPTITSNYDEKAPLKRRVINLCGHTHTKNRWCDWDKGLIYHVELDAHDCYPVSIEKIINDLTNKIRN